jgi:AcrR family transcriptional regulator
MARVVKEHEYAAKRGDILDAAQRLIGAKGYEQMTIQHILDELQISKGAFYHYFGSKQAVLEALIDRMIQEAEQLLAPIVGDPQLPALEKFQRFFSASARWKSERKPFLLALMRVWYTDENALMRLKLLRAGVKHTSPMLATIIRQGLREGVLTTAYPDEIAAAVMALIEGLGNMLAEQILASPEDRMSQQRIERTVAAYCDALERTLGAASGTLELIDTQTIEEWLVAADAVLVTN